MKKPPKRLTVGLLMMLVAVSALSAWWIQYSRRIRFVFDNRSPSRVRDVTVSYAGQVRHLGPIGPRSQAAWRIAAPPGEPVRVAWDLVSPTGGPDRHVQAPAVTTARAGDLISIRSGN